MPRTRNCAKKEKIMNPAELAYRKTAVEGSSGFGLLIALYDTLAGNLKRAAQAQRDNDIQKRCQEINHALLVIGYLEDWIDRENGGTLAQKLIFLYSNMRAVLLEAQIKQSAEILEQQMDVILSIRGTWQELEARASNVIELPSPSAGKGYPNTTASHQERRLSSWST
jgi:flagellar biosynthetic protein FliS